MRRGGWLSALRHSFVNKCSRAVARPLPRKVARLGTGGTESQPGEKRAPPRRAANPKRLAPDRRRTIYPGGRRRRRTADCGPLEAKPPARRLPMPQTNTLPGLIFIILLALGLALAYPSWSAGGYLTGGVIAVIGFLIAAVLASSIKVANQWERVVVLRLGRFDRLAGPGLFFIIPILENTPYRIDIRVITSTFKAEKTLTRGTVP